MLDEIVNVQNESELLQPGSYQTKVMGTWFDFVSVGQKPIGLSMLLMHAWY